MTERAKLTELQTELAYVRESVRTVLVYFATPRTDAQTSPQQSSSPQTPSAAQQHAPDLQRHLVAVIAALRKFTEAQRQLHEYLGTESVVRSSIGFPSDAHSIPPSTALERPLLGVMAETPLRWQMRSSVLSEAATVVESRSSSARGGAPHFLVPPETTSDSQSLHAPQLQASIAKQLEATKGRVPKDCVATAIHDPSTEGCVRWVSFVVPGVMVLTVEFAGYGVVAADGTVHPAIARAHVRAVSEEGLQYGAPSRYSVFRSVGDQAELAAAYYTAKSPSEALVRMLVWAAAHKKLFMDPCETCHKVLSPSGNLTEPSPPFQRDFVTLKPYHSVCTFPA